MFFSENDTTFLEEVKGILPVSTATDRQRLWPFIEAAERKYILPVLGRTLYDELQKFHTHPTIWPAEPLTTDNDQGTVDMSGGTTDQTVIEDSDGSGSDKDKLTGLLKLVQVSEINLAYYLGFDLLNISMSDMGFTRTESQYQKGLYKYQEEKAQNYFRTIGLDGIDDILTYLEDNLEYFENWEDTEAYTLRQESIIPDTKVFNKICDISNSRLIFLRLQPFIQQVMDSEIMSVLGTTVYAALISELAKDEPGETYLQLKTQIRKPLAFLSVALLIKTTGTLTDKGFYFEQRNSLFPDSETRVAERNHNSNGAYNYYKRAGDQYLNVLRNWLTINTFPGYTIPTGNVYSRDNEGKKTFFAL
jgi:hypothetical protein